MPHSGEEQTKLIQMTIVYVIVVTYNGAAWLENCLGSLKASTVPVIPIVVDNCSQDETITLLETLYPEVILIKSKTNLGFGKANNLGIEHALRSGAEYLFLLNQDAWLYPDTIEKLISVHRRHQDFMILSPLHLEGMASRLDYLFARWISKEQSGLVSTESDVKMVFKAEICEVNFINAAMWLLPRKAFEIIGAFDPVFFHYGEDNDYANRARYHGYKIGFCPDIKGVHDRPQPSVNKDEASGQRMNRKKEISYLILLKNINSPFFNNFFLFGKTLSKTLWMQIKKRNAKEMVAIANLGVRIMVKLPKLIWHRRLSKQGQRVFLESQPPVFLTSPSSAIGKKACPAA